MPGFTDSSVAAHKAESIARSGAGIQTSPPGPFSLPTHHGRTLGEGDEPRYWTHIPQWDSITSKEFISNSFQASTSSYVKF